jgi:peptide deformylase
MKIVTDIEFLKKPCKKVRSIKEGMQIAEQLLEVLDSSRDAVGLAANQIGIRKRVCVIKVKDPIILINPTIISKFQKIFFKEACLSFPGTYITTERYANIMVKADNHEETLIFSGSKSMLECVCVQHEIDHLNSITMFDRIPKETELGQE